LLAQQLFAERALEGVDLAADGLVGESQFSRGSSQAALAYDRPEVQQVMVVQPFHGSDLYMSVKPTYTPRTSC
jgi:hypothetical protein